MASALPQPFGDAVVQGHFEHIQLIADIDGAALVMIGTADALCGVGCLEHRDTNASACRATTPDTGTISRVWVDNEVMFVHVDEQQGKTVVIAADHCSTTKQLSRLPLRTTKHLARVDASPGVMAVTRASMKWMGQLLAGVTDHGLAEAEALPDRIRWRVEMSSQPARLHTQDSAGPRECCDVTLPGPVELDDAALIEFGETHRDQRVCLHGTLRLKLGTATDVSALSSLVEVTGDIEVVDSIALTSLSMPSLRRIGGRLWVRKNQVLTRIGFDVLAEATEIEIDDNPLLERVDLHSLRAAREFFAANLPRLTTVSLPNVTRLERLRLSVLPQLSSLQGFEGLTWLDTLRLREMDTLATLAGLDNVTAVREIWVAQLPALADMSALDGVEGVRTLSVEDVPAPRLPTIQSERLNELTLTRLGVTSLDNLDIHPLGEFSTYKLEACHQLHDVRGLVSGPVLHRLIIHNNDGLVSLDGLQPLENIGRDLRISECDKLASLDGLENLRGLGTLYGPDISGTPPDRYDVELLLGTLPALTDVSALRGVETLWGGVSVFELDALDACVFKELVAAWQNTEHPDYQDLSSMKDYDLIHCPEY